MSREYSLPQKSVLIVDEDENLRRSLGLILTRAGYKVATVGKTCEALERLRISHNDLIILDISTPENRQTLLPTVLCLYSNLAVLVFSTHWSPETALEIEQLGVQAHLEKPVTPKSLLECVDSILKENPDPT